MLFIAFLLFAVGRAEEPSCAAGGAARTCGTSPLHEDMSRDKRDIQEEDSTILLQTHAKIAPHHKAPDKTNSDQAQDKAANIQYTNYQKKHPNGQWTYPWDGDQQGGPNPPPQESFCGTSACYMCHDQPSCEGVPTCFWGSDGTCSSNPPMGQDTEYNGDGSDFKVCSEFACDKCNDQSSCEGVEVQGIKACSWGSDGTCSYPTDDPAPTYLPPDPNGPYDNYQNDPAPTYLPPDPNGPYDNYQNDPAPTYLPPDPNGVLDGSGGGPPPLYNTNGNDFTR